MKYTNQLMLMIAKFLYGETDAASFSFDFPAVMGSVYNDFQAENPKLCDLLEEDLPDICSQFDPYATGSPETLDKFTFRQKVMGIYQQALPLSIIPSKKVS